MVTFAGMLNDPQEQATREGPETGDEAERARRARLLRVAAHDLRGPLANIKSYVSLLRVTKTPLEPRVQRSLEVIARNADRAIALVDDGLDAARFESGALVYDRQLQPLGPLVKEALDFCRTHTQPLKVEVLGEISEALPQVEIDGFRVRRAIEAMILHLAGRSQPGQRVQLETRVEADTVRLEVRSPDAVRPAEQPFGGIDRMLEERAFEDPVRLWLAFLTARAHGGRVELLEGEAYGMVLILPL